MSLWQKIKNIFDTGPTIIEQLEQIVEEEKAVLKNLKTSVDTSVDKVEDVVKAEAKSVNSQITDAVTQTKQIIKKPRTPRKKKVE